MSWYLFYVKNFNCIGKLNEKMGKVRGKERGGEGFYLQWHWVELFLEDGRFLVRNQTELFLDDWKFSIRDLKKFPGDSLVLNFGLRYRNELFTLFGSCPC